MKRFLCWSYQSQSFTWQDQTNEKYFPGLIIIPNKVHCLHSAHDGQNLEYSTYTLKPRDVSFSESLGFLTFLSVLKRGSLNSVSLWDLWKKVSNSTHKNIFVQIYSVHDWIFSWIFPLITLKFLFSSSALISVKALWNFFEYWTTDWGLEKTSKNWKLSLALSLNGGK